MDQPIKVAVLGALGILTVAACVFIYQRQTSGNSSVSGAKPSTAPSSSANNETHDDGTDPLVKLRELDDLKGKSCSSSSSTPLAVVTDSSEGPNGTDSTAFSESATVKTAEAGDRESGKEGEGERMGASEEGAGQEEEGQEALVARFNQANSMARKFFKAQRYDSAAEQYGVALELCDRLPNHEDKRTALHNNRGAAYEKSGKYAKSLAECAMCLSRDRDHPLARVRKSRVLEALGKPVEALNEVCAHLLLERDRVLVKQAALNPSQLPQPPPPPANLEGLLQKVAIARADKILAQREAEKFKESEGGDAAGGSGATKRKTKPLPKQAVLELLRSFGSFAQLERHYKGMLESAITRELEVEDVGSDNASSASRVSTLLDRCKLRLVKRNYEGAREDVFEAAEILTKLDAEAGEGESGVPCEVAAGVYEWQGTFLQFGANPDGAKLAYERCSAVMESQGKSCTTDVLMKLGWVYMDKEDAEEAETYFKRAMESDPEYGSCYAHRARLHADTEGRDIVKGYLAKALSKNKQDVFAWEQLAKIHLQVDDVEAAMKTVDEGLKNVPKAAVLLTLKAELKYSLAIRMADGSQGPALLSLFEEAIKADPLSPHVYLNKAAFALQMMQDFTGATEVLEKAVEVDPTCVPAIVQLANLKIQTAKTLDDAEAAAALLNTAVELCDGREELTETLSVLVATEARMNGAKILGRKSLG